MSERTIQNGYLIAAQSDIEALRLRVKKLESMVRAADRMREGVESAINSYRRHELDGWEIAVVSTRMQDYDTQRAAVGEIGEE